MARRDTTPTPAFDVSALGGGAAPQPPGDGLDRALCGGTARLRQVALRITRDASAAEDVVQNALEQALRHRATFRGDAKASTWLHRIVVNQALMWRRSEGRRRTRLAEIAEASFDATEPAPAPLDELLARERREWVQRALRTLHPEDTDLLGHCARGADGYAAWAQHFGIKPTAAKTRAFRARRQLRAALEADRRAQG
jgi:RNA polymerase sigma-70 factor (ECF subfamily)